MVVVNGILVFVIPGQHGLLRPDPGSAPVPVSVGALTLGTPGTLGAASLPNTVGEAVRKFFPGYFALVMATGIVSIASHLVGMVWVAWALVWINVGAYLILAVMTLFRLARFPSRVRGDLTDHGRGPGFFTAVAGTCVLGSQLLVVVAQPTLALGLWWLGLGLWVLVTFAFFTAITVRETKPPLERGINRAWLIAIVATQSVSILGTLVAPQFGEARELVLFNSLGFFLWGCILYLLIITLIFYRFTSIVSGKKLSRESPRSWG